MSKDSAEADKSMPEYQQRLEAFGAGARSMHSGLSHGLENCAEIAPPTTPDPEPALGHLTMAAFVGGKQIPPADGNVRAARREKSWYPF